MEINGPQEASDHSHANQKKSLSGADYTLNHFGEGGANLTCPNPGLAAISHRAWDMVKRGRSSPFVTIVTATVSFSLKDEASSVRRKQCVARQSRGISTSIWTGVWNYCPFSMSGITFLASPSKYMQARTNTHLCSHAYTHTYSSHSSNPLDKIRFSNSCTIRMRRGFKGCAGYLSLCYKLLQSLAAKKDKPWLSHRLRGRKLTRLGCLWLRVSDETVVKVSAEAAEAAVVSRLEAQQGGEDLLRGSLRRLLTGPACSLAVGQRHQFLPQGSTEKLAAGSLQTEWARGQERERRHPRWKSSTLESDFPSSLLHLILQKQVTKSGLSSRRGNHTRAWI